MIGIGIWIWRERGEGSDGGGVLDVAVFKERERGGGEARGWR